MLGYKKGAHTTTDIRYHFVFTPKYRAPCLAGIAEDVAMIFYDVAARLELEIISLCVACDHVHLLVQAPPKYSPSTIAEKLKAYSSKAMGARLYWGRGFFCATVGNTMRAAQNYINNHGEKRRKK